MASESRSGKGRSKRSRRDPSAGGWDATIVKAPDSRSSSSGKHHRRHRRHKLWPRVVAGILVAVAVLAGAGVAAGMLYMSSLDSAMSLGEETDDITSKLADVPVAKPFYMLVMGLDTREGIAAENYIAAHPDQEISEEGPGSGGETKSDIILLLRVDAAARTVSMLTIPRDTPYTFEDGTIGKLNSAYVRYGATGVIDAVQDLTGLSISHYAQIHGNDFVTMVDQLGGITVDVPITFDYTNINGTEVHLDKGMQHIDGEQALALAGMRTKYSGANRDVKRQSAVREVVKGIMDAILARPALQIPGTVADAASCVKTDMQVSEIVDTVRKMGTDIAVYSGSGPADGALDPYLPDDTTQEGFTWLCYVNESGWQRVLESFTAGEDFSDVSYDDDVVHYAGQPESTWSKGLVKPNSD